MLFWIQAALVSRWKKELETFASYEAFRAAYGEPSRSYDPKIKRHRPGGLLILIQHYYQDFEGLGLTWIVYENGSSKLLGGGLFYGDTYGNLPTGEREAASRAAYQSWLACRDPVTAIRALGPPDDWFEATGAYRERVWERHVYFDVEGLGFDIIMVTYDTRDPDVVVLPHRRRYRCLVGPISSEEE